MHTIELPKLPKVSDVAKATSAVTGVQLGDIYGSGRTREFVRARWVICYIARKSLLKSLPVIGNCLNRDHTTILHGINGAQRLIDGGDKEMISCIEKVKEAVGIPGDTAILESVKRWEKSAVAHTNPMLRSFATAIFRDSIANTEEKHEV